MVGNDPASLRAIFLFTPNALIGLSAISMEFRQVFSHIRLQNEEY